MPAPNQPLSMRPLLVAIVLLAAASFANANPALEGYLPYEPFAAAVSALAESSPHVAVRSLAKTKTGRDVLLLTLGRGETDKRPAVLIVGGLAGEHVIGSELALRTAQQLANRAAEDEDFAAQLDQVAYYIIPRASPDEIEKAFAGPFVAPLGNSRPTDDDRDGEQGEDPPNDLDNDGWITSLRVEDSSGEWMPHPDDPRVLIKADPKKNEQGQYRLLSEGVDDDQDGEWNEDPGGGVALNRNFPFDYPYFKPNTGPHQASEPEVRALADFAFDHPNIVAVFSFSPHDNLFHPPKPKPSGEQGRIKTQMLSGDSPYHNFLADAYRKAHGGKDAPAASSSGGGFAEWAYFHYGVWSLASTGWWVPKVEAEPAEGEAKPSGEKRGGDDLNALRWLAANNIEGFAQWRPVEHPDFPGKKVEAGGFRDFFRHNPPAEKLDPIAEKHAQYLAALPKMFPKLAVAELKIEPLGAGVVRVTAVVMNQGYLPTMTEIGEVVRRPYPLQIKLASPPGAKLLQGSSRTTVKRLAGRGDTSETTWLVRTPGPNVSFKVDVWAPAVGAASAEATLSE